MLTLGYAYPRHFVIRWSRYQLGECSLPHHNFLETREPRLQRGSFCLPPLVTLFHQNHLHGLVKGLCLQTIEVDTTCY